MSVKIETEEPTTIEAMLNIAQRPERSAVVCLRPDLVAALQEEEARGGDSTAPTDPKRMSAKSHVSRTDQLRAELAASRVTFRFRCLTDEEVEAIEAETPIDETKDDAASATTARIAALMAKQCVSHKVTAGEIVALWNILGPELNAAVEAATAARTESVAKSPFWRELSGSPRR